MKKFQSILDSELGVLDELQDGGIREVMSTEETIQPSSGNANEARLFAIEASESQEAEPVGRPRLQRAECVNAISRNRGLRQFLVRGLKKVRAVTLWFAIAHNLMRAVALRAQGALVAVKHMCPNLIPSQALRRKARRRSAEDALIAVAEAGSFTLWAD